MTTATTSVDASARTTSVTHGLGGAVADLEAQLPAVLDAVPEARVHLYGKAVKTGRKVGHVTVLGEDLARTIVRARRAADLLEKGKTDV